MNIQNSPAEIRTAAARFPAAAEEPIRSQYLSEDRLRALGESLARGDVSDLAGLEPFDFQKRNRDSAKKILEVYRLTNAAQARGETVTPAAQWLLDNNYLVEETIYQIKRDLPRRFYRQLPTLKLADGTAIPRALAVAWAYVAHSDSSISSQMFKAIVEGFQSIEPMKIGEIWALPSLLRFVLIENLRRLAVRVNRSRDMRLIANDVADKVLAAGDSADRQSILGKYQAHAGDTTFATQLLYRLRDGSQNAGRALEWLEAELEKSGTDAEEITIAEHQTLSSGNVTTGNIIRGLRLINDVDWTVWFEGVSRIDALLRERTNFSELDFASRDQYRTEIEELAKRSKQSEYVVAEKATDMAAAAGQAVDQATDAANGTDIGFFLVGSRRPELEKAIGYSPSLGRSFLRGFRKTGWLGIVLPVFLLTVLLLWLTGNALAALGLPIAGITLMLLLFAVPASEGALAFFNTVVLLFLKPTRLVGYEYKDGIPVEARTLVVVPSLIGSRDDVEENVRNIEVHHLANMSGELHFALLSDWPDSKAEISANDTEILDFAHSQIAMLNQRYPTEGAPRFYLLHRRRLYNPAQGAWMGWERKRGKLHELNLLLRGDSDTTFLPLETPLPENIVHVMTLDADTRTTRDAIAKLIGKMCHPMNKPHFDPVKRRVTAGYGIMQPRITPSLTTGDEASFFQRVFSANRGLDPYVFAVSDLYQDVFGDGSFTGKGLYHIDAFEAALKGRIEDNTVLSHDLLEGALARSALVTDVELVEDYPTRYWVDASRTHRWARGDWQLLSFIFDPRSGVPALSRWKMIDNLRRSLTPIFWVMAAIAGWTLLPFTQAAQWQALLILTLFMAPTFDIVNAIIPKSSDATPRGHFSALAHDIAFGTAMVALKIVLMAHQAWMMGDAIIRTLYRLFVSRKNLARMAHRLAGAQGQRKRHRLLLQHDVWRGDHRRHRPRHPGVRRFYRRLRRLRLRPVLDRLAGLCLAGQPFGRNRGPAAPVAAGRACAARRGAPHLALFRELRHGRTEPSAAGQFPGKPEADRGVAHLADQYRRLFAFGRLGPRFRLDQPVGSDRAHRRDHADHRAHGAQPRPSLQLVRDDDAQPAASDLYFSGRQRQSRRPSGDGGGDLRRMGGSAVRASAWRCRGGARHRGHPQ
ncbi:hypothetical protein ACHMW9_20140 [Mesorhizobium terrae]